MGMSLKIFAPWLIVLAAIGALFGAVWVVVALMISAPVYIVSLILHPNRNCWFCRGTGQNWGFLFDYARRPCAACAGTGTQRRWGRKLFFS